MAANLDEATLPTDGALTIKKAGKTGCRSSSTVLQNSMISLFNHLMMFQGIDGIQIQAAV